MVGVKNRYFIAPLALVLCPAMARAEVERFQGTFRVIVAAENLFGVQRSSAASTRNDAVDAKVDVSFLGSRGLGQMSLPRVGIHVVSGVGGTVGLEGAWRGEEHKKDLIVAPRFGYLAEVSRGWFFWPRAGLTFRFVREDLLASTPPAASKEQVSFGVSPRYSAQSFTSRRLAASLSVPLIYTPVSHAGFMASPGLEIPLLARDESVDTPQPLEVGLLFGIFTYF